MDEAGAWHGGRLQHSRHCVRWDSTPSPKRRRSLCPQFSAYFYCGQTAGCIKMSLGMEVGLGLCDTVRCGASYPQKKGHTHSHPIFGPCLLWPNGWMDGDTAWYGSRPRRRPHCTRRGPSSRERGTEPPCFRPMSIVATVAQLSYC